MNRTLIAALAVALAACGGSSSTANIGLSQPASVAVFDGVASKHPGEAWPYLAVANAGHDELVLIDPVDDEPVMAPILVRALSLPTPDPRPALVAAADLGDDLPGPVKRADLLVAVASGATGLQLVQTWAAEGDPDGAPRVVPEHEVELGAPILALTAMPIADGEGAASGRARVIAALVGARLAVVEYVRQADGSIAPVPGGPVIQELRLAAGEPGFEALSLAWDPADLGHLYAASADPIPTATGDVEGVAQLDVTGTPGAWTWRGLDARAPTRLVAAWTLRERIVSGEAADDPAQDAFEGQPSVPRVYAFLDPGRCGPTARVACGIAVLDPVAGAIVPDLSGRMPYLAPIPVPGLPTALAISGPPAVPPSESPFRENPDVMKVLYGTAVRGTTAMMAVPTTSGSVYYVDLGRWAIPTAQEVLRTASTRTAPTAAAVNAFSVKDPDDASAPNVPQSLAIWTRVNNVEVLRTDGAGMITGVTVTPGYTPSETWTITHQGVLPGLELRPTETGDAGGGRTWLALQVTIPRAGGGERVTQVTRLYDPALGVQAGAFGDFVLVITQGLIGTVNGQSFACPDRSDARAAEFILPDATRPGGAVVLQPLPCDGLTDDALAACVAQQTCIAEVLRAGQRGLRSTVRASDRMDSDRYALLVVGSGLGYAGRTPVAGTSSSAGYRLEYPAPPVSEDTLTCPLDPWPYPEEIGAVPPAVTDCRDATCRARCESLLLARKARRFHHLSDSCSAEASSAAACRNVWPPAQYPFPLADGPVVAFRAAVAVTRTVNGASQVVADTRAPTPGLFLVLQTRSGVSLSSRSPTNLGGTPSLPRGAAAFDRSTFEGRANEGYRFFVPYVDGHVFDFSPAQSSSAPVVIR